MTFTMKEIVIFSLCLITVPGRSAGNGIQQLESYRTGGILIVCKYADQYKHKEKYFCKGNNITCPLKRLAHNYDNRVFLYNSVQRDSLTVLITNLTLKDLGNYHCRDEDGSLYASFSLRIREGDCCDSPSTTTGREGRHVKIQCKYPKESNVNITYFCKQDDKFIELDLINSKHLQKNTKYSLTDNKNRKTFTVIIHDLERKDGGIYWCGVRTGGNNVALTRQVNLQITERQIMQMEGFTRGGIVILCQFDDQNQHNQRYFCKGNATTCIYNHLTHDSPGRIFKQHENVLLNSLTVVITNLTADDAGTYHCVEDGKLHTIVHLTIKEGDCCDLPSKATGEKGGRVTIQCNYSVEFTDNNKHLCKIGEGCKKLELIDPKPKVNQKYSLSDNKNENAFTVTIHDLEGKDSGIYWCGVQLSGSYTILLRNTVLQVSDDTKIPVPNTETAVLVLIVALVLIIALGLTVALFLCYKHRERGKQDVSNIVIYHNAENPYQDGIYEEIEDIGLKLHPLTGCNYTKVDNAGDPTYYTIQSPPNLPDDTGLHLLSKKSHTKINTIYATAELPTIPGDVPTYSNIQSPIHTSADTHLSTDTDEIDSTVSTVYTIAQCPINPSDIPTPRTDQPDSTNPTLSPV